ncbi:hypothetical protein CDAR_457821 [Caerostris darwini]|uniref:Uncharacterized protein n=1 Tax=Caerostris darwini TaxID=1538125 RepID=A0AAV4V9E3_9ARAC|nr:hypothetical protein CDAR_457821 [Caerostris darwini]
MDGRTDRGKRFASLQSKEWKTVMHYWKRMGFRRHTPASEIALRRDSGFGAENVFDELGDGSRVNTVRTSSSLNNFGLSLTSRLLKFHSNPLKRADGRTDDQSPRTSHSEHSSG